MNAIARIERALSVAVELAEGPGCPPGLAGAVRHAVFSGASRIRPRLCLAVADACGEIHPTMSDAAATAIELMHCASLVHDDLPCFDDAATRRGRASVHKAFGAPLAVLTGDAMIVLAFETLARAAVAAPALLGDLVICIGRATGMPGGISAGQAWECEPRIDLSHYHRAKTGSLFVAAAVAGAIVAGVDPAPWQRFGEFLGEAYQVADDIRDAVLDAETLGKPAAQDAALGRPNAVLQLGVSGAVERLEELVADAVRAIPPCDGAAELRALIASEAVRLVPKELSRQAA